MASIVSGNVPVSRPKYGARAASCARLLRDQGKPAEARALLAPIHAWFGEGFDAVPLREARGVLESLAA
jgi:hypothetical protein